MKKLSLIPALFALMFLNACGPTGPTPEEPIETTPPAQVEEPAASEEATVDIVLEGEIFNNALRLRDTKICDLIQDTSILQECLESIAGLEITDEAAAAQDKSLCEQIKNERYKENCSLSVDAALAQQIEIDAKNAEADALDEKRLTIEEDAVAKGDAELCNKISDSGQRVSCRYNILANQAVEQNDASLCKGIGEKTSEAFCVSAVTGEPPPLTAL